MKDVRDALTDGKLFPDRPYYRIGEVARLLGVDTHVIRYWESEFPQLKPRRAPSGHRVYQPEDVRQLQKIQELLHGQGYTLAGVKRLLEHYSLDNIPAKEPETPSERQDSKALLLELKEILTLLDD
ncbi:MerR family transcriptional regulator [Dethiosulfatarculus sandiegensis]|uniref:MerR family transcriptional regulator n=1 Tax=Dethiosulfatarculus sandiegensis TaxID=1429043 RepID=A0A0D2G9A4_9BACT|nr:MerR family transcriptional regulator [Dethiosulfatarculus sandiegensis]KIX11442.1 MerR family transcriptional regulator [Dethiosulfatarculus sandiegensis]